MGISAAMTRSVRAVSGLAIISPSLDGNVCRETPWWRRAHEIDSRQQRETR